MPLAYPVYYVTHANEALRKLAQEYDMPELSTSGIWYNEETGSGSDTSFYILRFKMVYLAKWKINLEGRLGTKYHKVIKALLGMPPFDIRQFDIWWTVERLPLADDRVHEFLAILSVNDLEAFAPTGDIKFDSWKEDWIAFKKQKPRED